MKMTELKNKSHNELGQMLAELRGKLLQLRFDHMEKKLKDFSQLGKIKREIAQVLTAMKLVNK